MSRSTIRRPVRHTPGGRPGRRRVLASIVAGAALLASVAFASPAGAAVGDMSTLAGTGAGCPSSACWAFDGQPAPSAILWNPTGVTLATDGTAYIADNRNNGVRVVRDGVIDTVVDDGLGPYDVALDEAAGVLYVSESAAGSYERVRAIDLASGTATVLAGGASGFAGDGGPASAARFNQIAGIAVGPDGDVYVADKGNQRVRRIDMGAQPPTIDTIAGTGAAGGDDGAATTVAQLANPQDVAVAPDGTVYISDQLTNRVRILTGGNVGSFAGNFTAGFSGDGGPATSAALRAPTGLAVAPDGRVLIGDSQNNRIRAVSPGGTISTIAGDGTVGNGGDGGPATAAQLSNPIGVAVNSAGAIAIASQLGNTVRLIEGASVPGPVVGLKATVDGTSVTLTWSPPASDGGAPVTSYLVFRDGTQIAELDAPAGTFTDTGRTPATTITYQVVAVNVAGPGPASSVEATIANSPITPTTTPSTTPGGSGTTPATPVRVTPRYTG